MDLEIEAISTYKNFGHDFSYGQIGMTKYFDMIARVSLRTYKKYSL